MKVIGLEVAYEHCSRRPDSKKWFENWLKDAQSSKWKTFHDIRARYASASFLAPTGVIFNVKGNTYRMVTRVAYGVGVIKVEWIGTHAEYNRKY
jgi:mRNA interferase HigB